MFWHMHKTTLPVSIELVILFLSFFLLKWCITLMIVYVELFLHPRDKSHFPLYQFSSVQSLSCVQLFVTPWTAACQAYLSIINSQSLLKLMSIEPVMASNHLIFCIPFSSCFQSFPAPGSFPMSQFFTSGGQSIGASASASILPINIQDWFPLRLTGLISSLSKGFSRSSPTPQFKSINS